MSYCQSLTTPNPSIRSMTVTHGTWLIFSHSDDSLRFSGDHGWQILIVCTVEILVKACGGVSRVCVKWFMWRKMTGLNWGVQVSKPFADSGLFCRVSSRSPSTLYTSIYVSFAWVVHDHSVSMFVIHTNVVVIYRHSKINVVQTTRLH